MDWPQWAAANLLLARGLAWQRAWYGASLFSGKDRGSDSSAPITGTALGMGYGYDLNFAGQLTEDDEVGESLEHQAAGAL